MEAPKTKMTAKLSPQGIDGHGTSSSSFILPSPEVVVRAQISSTARARSSSNIPASSCANGSSKSNIKGALRPQAATTARRSPSPAKMRAGSPSKLQSQLKPSTFRAPLVTAATIMPHADRVRHGSISVLSLAPGDPSSSTASVPTTPVPHRDTNNILNGDSSYLTLDSGSGSFRIKSKVSGLVKPAPPSLSAILSPPSPSSPSFPSPFPNATYRPRARATTVASRRPSVSFTVTQSHPSQTVTPHLFHEPAPLPTSPPASTLSFSSHSSLSASSAQPHSTNTGLSPPASFTSHVRSESSPVSTLDIQGTGDPSSSHDEHPVSPLPRRALIARVRPGTRISGGRGQGRTSGSSVAGERDLGTSNSARTAELDNRSTDESEGSDNETRKKRPQSNGEEGTEGDVRAEAKSNRKIADLEITTRSLLTINAALEASKLRQAREIRELRRKLRETRLAMPPGRFRLLNEQERAEGNDVNAKEEESDEDEEDVDGDQCDESFKRVKLLLEDLLAAGRSAVTTPSPSSPSAHQAIPSPSCTSANKLGLGADTLPATGTRKDQSEVLGWDVGSSLGTGSSSNVVDENGSRRWKHGVAIGSKVLSPEEARLWVGEDVSKEERSEDGDRVDPELVTDGAGSSATDQDTTNSCDDMEPDVCNALA